MEKEENKVKKLSLYILGGISLAIYLAFTIFLLIEYFSLSAQVKAGENVAVALVVAIIIIFYGIIVYGASSILAIAGLIVSIVKRKKGLSVGWIIGFIVMSVLPIITEVLMYLLYSLPL